MVLSFPALSPMRNASTKRSVKYTPFKYNQRVQTEEVHCNPKNPVNPDSEIECWG
jgi:hypothetical protein